MAGRRGTARGGAGRGTLTPGRGEIYLEYTSVGGQLRAAAIDAATGVEVVVFGPANVVRDELGQLAVRKLMNRLEALRDGHAGEKPAGGRYA